MTATPHVFRWQLRDLSGTPICGFDIVDQARAWGRRVMGAPYDIVDAKTGESYRAEPDEAEREAKGGPSEFDGATLTNLTLIYNAGCCDPSFREAREAIERALASVRPSAGRAALAAQLMLAILHGDHR